MRGIRNFSSLSFQSVFVDDPFSRKNDTPALPPKKGVPPRPKPPSGTFYTLNTAPSMERVTPPINTDFITQWVQAT